MWSLRFLFKCVRMVYVCVIYYFMPFIFIFITFLSNMPLLKQAFIYSVAMGAGSEQ